MLVGLVHTAASPCRCAEFIGKRLRALGHETFEVDADRVERSLGALAAADLVFDHTASVAARALFRATVPARDLPPMGWDEGASGVISWDRKLAANEDTFKVADLGAEVLGRLEQAAAAAFRALALRDYARFDVRIDAAGTPFFLDANT